MPWPKPWTLAGSLHRPACKDLILATIQRSSRMRCGSQTNSLSTQMISERLHFGAHLNGSVMLRVQ
jgi:hypothetical protein